MIKPIIEKMLSEIQNHKRKKEDLLSMYVQIRINKQVQTYYKQILDSYNTLKYQNDEPTTVKKIIKNLV